MDEMVNNTLLKNVPIGPELREPRLGVHDNATLTAVSRTDNGRGWFALRLTFANMTDAEGHEFEFDTNITLPTSESEPIVQRMFLAALHDLGVVAKEDKRARTAETEEHREAYCAAVEAKIGTVYPVKITEGDIMPNLRFQRRKK